MRNNACLQFTIAALFVTGAVIEASFAGVSASSVNKTKELHIIAMVPFLINPGMLPYLSDRFGYHNAIKMAVEHINDQSDILKDHKIKIHYGETFKHVSVALKSFFHQIYTPPKKVAMLGPAYSLVTLPLTHAASIHFLTQISYASIIPTTVVEKAKSFFPYFYRSTPSIVSFNKAKIGFLNSFGWNRVGIIYDYTQTLFFQPSCSASIKRFGCSSFQNCLCAVDTIQKEFKKENVGILSIEGFSSDWGQKPHHQIQKLKQLDARVILGEFSTNGARQVFCEAYKNKMYGRKYVWLIPGTMNPGWYTNLRSFKDCTSDQLLEAAEGYFVVTRLDLRTDGKSSFSGLTSSQFLKDLKNRTRNAKTYASFAYDAVWTLAFALDKASKTMDLSKFNYTQQKIAKNISKLVEDVKFEAVSGPLQFNQKERLGGVRLQQFRKGKNVDVAEYILYLDNGTVKGDLKFCRGEKEKLWKGAPPPLDHAVIQNIPIQYPVSLLAVMWTIALIGIVTSIFFLYVNIFHSQNRLIKMSSPHVNNIIIVGCIICYITVILLGVDTQLVDNNKLPQFCNAGAWTLSIGFTLSFGALFSKTWRVYKIFTAARPMERVAILDWHLYGIIILLLALDIIILTVWMIMAPFYLDISEVSRKEDTVNDVLKIFQLYKCSSKQEVPFTSVIYAYKGVLLLFGLFLAWETRHVEVPALNDSKFIGMSVYNVGALSAVGIICTYALSGTASIKERYTIVSMCINLCTTVTLCLMFVPKIRLLFSKSNTEDLSRLSATSQSRHGCSFSEKQPSITSNGINRQSSTNSSFIKPFSHTMTDNCRPNNQNGVIEPRSDRTWSQATEICYQEDVMPGSVPLKLTASESTILETEEIETDSVSDCQDSDGESNRSNSFKRSVKEIKLKEHDRDSGGSCNSDSLKRMPMIKPEPTLDEESGEEAHEVKKTLSNGNGAIHLNTAL